jgi:MinD superfamily P-loop ATPase
VEEPNLHLFLKPVITSSREAFMDVPLIDEALCDYCKKCSELCQFKAISVFNKVVLTFPDMCHGCGGCKAICPKEAISWGRRVLGEIVSGTADKAGFIMGRLRVGEAMSPPLIRKVVEIAEEQTRASAETPDVLFDAPPGVSCPAVNAVMESDVMVLVTEPTPFGVFDLRLAHQAFTPIGKPMGVVVNRAGLGNDEVYRFCRSVNLPIFAEIPYDRAIAEAYANGIIVSRSTNKMKTLFKTLAETIRDQVPADREVRHA